MMTNIYLSVKHRFGTYSRKKEIFHKHGNQAITHLHVSNKRQSKVELANEEIRVRGVDSILD
jgi:hypothetical protein